MAGANPAPDGPQTLDDGFGGFAPRLPDDTVEYEIRLLDDKLTEKDVRQELRKIQAASIALAKKLLRGYIWQREAFGIDIVKDGAPLLRGRTGFGDSVEDEWLVVYLLRELSRQFPAVWVRVVDGDGEFLLAEAANVLPKWVNPDIAEHRVWINRGQLLLIPPTSHSASDKERQPATFISLPQALAALRRPRNELLHSPLIEEEAFYRLRNYPDQIQRNFHHALVRIPRRLAFILHQLPASVAPAVEAFYLRDPIALRPLKESAAADLSFPPKDFVTARVKFPKVGFAQVHTQHFVPVGVWADACGADEGNDTKIFQRAEMGMKLACGFEMLVADPQNQDRQSVREIKLLLDDLDQGAETLPPDGEVKSWGTDEDDDSWMDIDFRDFEDELAGRAGGNGPDATDRKGFGDKTAQENLQKMVSRFEAFLNDDALADDDEDNESDDSDEDEELEEGEDKAASFEEDEFTALMREMMGMPPEAMRELMGAHAPTATGLAEGEHPDFTEGGEELEKRLEKLFSALDVASDGAGDGQKPADKPSSKGKGKAAVESDHEPDEDDEDDEDDVIKELSAQMEAELRKAGALDLRDPSLKGLVDSKGSKSGGVGKSDGSEDEELLDEDYNLVSNLLRSFGDQAGAPGPAGNVMGMMGVRMPRDDGENERDGGGGGPSGKRRPRGHVKELE